MRNLYVSEPLEGLESRVKAVLFDCDGTLVDTMPAHYRSWEHTLRAVRVDRALEYRAFYEWAGMAGDEVARLICEHLDLDHDPLELAERKRGHFMEQEPDHPVIEPVADFARRLAGTLPIAVVSGGQRETVERTLASAGLRGLFDTVVTPEDVLHGKPAPDMFLLAAERLGVAPGECLVLEDGPPGIRAAEAAGMRVVVVGPAAESVNNTENLCQYPY